MLLFQTREKDTGGQAASATRSASATRPPSWPRVGSLPDPLVFSEKSLQILVDT
jgi:hypothetical protein